MLILSQFYVKECFDYDPLTGCFIWKIKRQRIRCGNAAGTISYKDGYIRIKIKGIRYMAHRLAWFYMYGQWPDGQIDHINGVRSDNRIENLRDVTPSVNRQNQRSANCNNKLGKLGVHFRHGKFIAAIRIKGKLKNIGFFESAESAHAAYIEEKRKLHEGCTI